MRSRLHRREHAEYITIRCCIWKHPGGWPVGMRLFVWFIVMAEEVWCTGQPGRPCGRHKLSLSEVQWLGVYRPQQQFIPNDASQTPPQPRHDT